MTKLMLLRGLMALLLATDVLRAQLADPTTTVAPVVEITTTASPVVTTATPTTTASTVAPTTTASVVPASTLATTTRGPTTTRANTPTTTSTPEPSETTAAPSPSPTTKTSSSSSGRSTFRGFADLDDWVWWVIIGGGSFVILIAVVCCFICIRRGKEKAREEAVQAMEEQREADNHARLLAEAQKQRRDRENQQNRGSVASNANGSASETSPAKRPSFYRRPSQGRGAYLATSSSSLQSSALPPPIHTSHHHVDGDGSSAPYVSVQSPTNGGATSPYHPPSSVNERIEALKARSSLPQQKDSYSSEPGFLVQSPPFPTGAPVNQPTNPRDTTLTGYSMDIDGDYESTVGDTFLSPSTKDSLYQELDAAKLNSPTRAAAAAIKSTDSKRSDASDFELDVDGEDDATQRERVPSHRSIEF